jgi:hypothetical protein
MKIKLFLIAGVLACLMSSCSDCDPENVFWIGSYSGATECFDTTTITDVLILQGNAENNFQVVINGSDPLSGFSTSCNMELPVVPIPVSQLETAIRKWEITIDGDMLNYKESSTSSLSGLAVTCEGVLLRQ